MSDCEHTGGWEFHGDGQSCAECGQGSVKCVHELQERLAALQSRPDVAGVPQFVIEFLNTAYDEQQAMQDTCHQDTDEWAMHEKHKMAIEVIQHLLQEKNTNPNYHPCLYLLAEENTGWRRWLSRWKHSSEPFRGDIQRRIAAQVIASNRESSGE